MSNVVGNRRASLVASCAAALIACMTAGLVAQRPFPPLPAPPSPASTSTAPGPGSSSPKFIELTNELRKHVAFDAIYDVDRATFDQVVNTLLEADAQPSGSDILQQVLRLLNPRITRYVRAATDQAVVEYYRAMVAQLDATLADPKVCRAAAATTDIDVSIPITPAAAARMQDPLAALILSAKGRYTDAVMPIDTARRHMASATSKILQGVRDIEILNSAAKTPADAARRCQLTIALWKSVLNQPEDVAADLFRWIAMKSAQQ